MTPQTCKTPQKGPIIGPKMRILSVEPKKGGLFAKSTKSRQKVAKMSTKSRQKVAKKSPKTPPKHPNRVTFGKVRLRPQGGGPRCRPTIDKKSTKSRQKVDKMSTKSRQNVAKKSPQRGPRPQNGGPNRPRTLQIDLPDPPRGPSGPSKSTPQPLQNR